MSAEKELGFIYIKSTLFNFKVLWAAIKSVLLNLLWITVGFGAIITFLYEGNFLERVCVLIGSTLILAIVLGLPCVLLSVVMLWRTLKTNEEKEVFLKFSVSEKGKAIGEKLWS